MTQLSFHIQRTFCYPDRLLFVSLFLCETSLSGFHHLQIRSISHFVLAEQRIVAGKCWGSAWREERWGGWVWVWVWVWGSAHLARVTTRRTIAQTEDKTEAAAQSINLHAPCARKGDIVLKCGDAGRALAPAAVRPVAEI